MNWNRVFATLLASSVLVVAGVSVQAEDKKEEKKDDKKAETIGAPKGAEGTVPTPLATSFDSGCGGCGPQYTTVWVTVCTPETYLAKRTVLKPITVEEKYTAYRTECILEKYTAYRTECVAEPRTCTVTVNKIVPEVVTGTHTVWTCVPTVEQRTVCKPICVTKQVTTFHCVSKDCGHYECVTEEVCAKHSLFRHKGCGDCCEPCPTYKTKKVWVPNIVTEQIPVTKCVKTTEYVNEVVNVTVLKKVATQQPYTCTVNRCVPESHVETFTVLVPHQVAFEATRSVPKCVAYEATRLVTKCVPTEETYTATRMVSHQVAKQVPVVECCEEVHHARKSWLSGWHKKCCD